MKPYVLIHTLMTLDGKINSVDVPRFTGTSELYQALALYPDQQVFDIDGYLNGRTSTDDNITHYRTPAVNEKAAPVPEGDFVAVDDATMYYISMDPWGRLGWETNDVFYGKVHAHVIEILTDQVSNAYKAFLRQLNISYIIAGENAIDKPLALRKLAELFNIQRMMIGGVINWSFLSEGLVDEVSILMGAFANGDPDMPALFTAKAGLSEIKPIAFELIDVQALEHDAVWLRYKVKGNE
ncbi:RibD family protein [Fundicoccus culcitae]|uniref:RibD family protein n=1 Tax=Fundicoccus culcitae TaxID=2969821 RepID=A0ABY5P963_9LACT|nr:RibD family protein [Fundicoccus culcitae]UUX35069.1 RibD family protein [Fundicoccus culcitae]